MLLGDTGNVWAQGLDSEARGNAHPTKFFVIRRCWPTQSRILGRDVKPPDGASGTRTAVLRDNLSRTMKNRRTRRKYARPHVRHNMREQALFANENSKQLNRLIELLANR